MRQMFPHASVVAGAGKDPSKAHHLLVGPHGTYDLVECNLCNGYAPFPPAADALFMLLAQPAKRPYLCLHVAAAGGRQSDVPDYCHRLALQQPVLIRWPATI